MRYSVLLLLLGLGLAACGNGPRQHSATSTSVTYEVARDDASEAEVMAEEYCGTSGRSARRANTSEYGASQRITYACV